MPIPPEAIPTTVAAIFSIAVSIKRLMTGNKVDSDNAIDLFKATASPRDRDLLSDPIIHASVAQITVISEPLLDQLHQEAQSCEDRHLKARQVSTTYMARTTADNDAAQCICSVLRDLRRFNNDELPPDSIFSRWWLSYRCQM
jgi:hypothetical protein